MPLLFSPRPAVGLFLSISSAFAKSGPMLTLSGRVEYIYMCGVVRLGAASQKPIFFLLIGLVSDVGAA